MASAETLTTAQAAKSLGVSNGTFRLKAKTAGIEPIGKVETGKRGRPGALWSKSQVGKLAK